MLDYYSIFTNILTQISCINRMIQPWTIAIEKELYECTYKHNSNKKKIPDIYYYDHAQYGEECVCNHDFVYKNEKIIK